MKKTKSSKWKKTVSVLSLIFFVISFLLLLFATFALHNDASLFGLRFYYVTTPSMEPDIMTGSLIISKKTDIAELKVGDVISFVSRDPDIMGMINNHNIHSICYDNNGSPVFRTKGTNNPIADEHEVYPHEIKGKVIFDSLTVGKVFSFLSNRWVSFCVTIIPLSVIVLIYFVDLVKVINFFPDDKKNGEEEKTEQEEELLGDKDSEKGGKYENEE